MEGLETADVSSQKIYFKEIIFLKIFLKKLDFRVEKADVLIIYLFKFSEQRKSGRRCIASPTDFGPHQRRFFQLIRASLVNFQLFCSHLPTHPHPHPLSLAFVYSTRFLHNI